jgi:lysophospholipase L1-like esterase
VWRVAGAGVVRGRRWQLRRRPVHKEHEGRKGTTTATGPSDWTVAGDVLSSGKKENPLFRVRGQLTADPVFCRWQVDGGKAEGAHGQGGGSRGVSASALNRKQETAAAPLRPWQQVRLAKYTGL